MCIYFALFSIVLIFFFMMREKLFTIKLKRNLKKNNLNVYAQAIVSRKNKDIIGFEVLVRWQNPISGYLKTEDLISKSEKTHCVKYLTEYCFKRAMTLLSEHGMIKSHSLFVFFNIGADDLRDDDIFYLCSKFYNNLEHLNAKIVLEITEREHFDFSSKTLELIDRLKKIGVLFALDDFGCGYSNLSYISFFKPSFVKIDKSFVNDVLINNISKSIIRKMTEVASSCGFIMIAEGVEDEKQFELLSSYGINYFQGYYFSQPIPLLDFLKKD